MLLTKTEKSRPPTSLRRQEKVYNFLFMFASAAGFYLVAMASERLPNNGWWTLNTLSDLKSRVLCDASLLCLAEINLMKENSFVSFLSYRKIDPRFQLLPNFLEDCRSKKNFWFLFRCDMSSRPKWGLTIEEKGCRAHFKRFFELISSSFTNFLLSNEKKVENTFSLVVASFETSQGHL